MKAVCVFCGSSTGKQEIYAEVAHQLGVGIASRGMAIVYVGIATLAGLLAWWIAARRYRRSRVLPGAE